MFMSVLELQERLDFLFKEVYNHNISIDDAKDEIEDELKEFMSLEAYESYVNNLNAIEEEMFQNDWNIVD